MAIFTHQFFVAMVAGFRCWTYPHVRANEARKLQRAHNDGKHRRVGVSAEERRAITSYLQPQMRHHDAKLRHYRIIFNIYSKIRHPCIRITQMILSLAKDGVILVVKAGDALVVAPPQVHKPPVRPHEQGAQKAARHPNHCERCAMKRGRSCMGSTLYIQAHYTPLIMKELGYLLKGFHLHTPHT